MAILGSVPTTTKIGQFSPVLYTHDDVSKPAPVSSGGVEQEIWISAVEKVDIGVAFQKEEGLWQTMTSVAANCGEVANALLIEMAVVPTVLF